MNRNIASLCGVLLAACAAAPPAPARLVSPGTYIVDYKWFDVLNEFGPGVERVRQEAASTKTYEESRAVWSRAQAETVPQYLAAKGIVPVECKQGVEVIRSGTTEGGGAWSEFRCKP